MIVKNLSLNMIVKNLSLNLHKEKYTRSRNICQLSCDTVCSPVSYVCWKWKLLQRRQVLLGRFSALVICRVKEARRRWLSHLVEVLCVEVVLLGQEDMGSSVHCLGSRRKHRQCSLHDCSLVLYHTRTRQYFMNGTQYDFDMHVLNNY